MEIEEQNKLLDENVEKYNHKWCYILRKLLNKN